MKTIAYNPQREILTALLTLILSFSLLIAVKAQGNSDLNAGVNGQTAMNELKTIIVTNSDLTEKEATENFLAEKIESWLKNGSYWDKSSEEATIVNELAGKIERWMSDGSFWCLNKNTQTDIDQLALSNKSEMNRDALYADEK